MNKNIRCPFADLGLFDSVATHAPMCLLHSMGYKKCTTETN
jgi:hypothetical protein